MELARMAASAATPACCASRSCWAWASLSGVLPQDAVNMIAESATIGSRNDRRRDMESLLCEVLPHSGTVLISGGHEQTDWRAAIGARIEFRGAGRERGGGAHSER